MTQRHRLIVDPGRLRSFLLITHLFVLVLLLCACSTSASPNRSGDGSTRFGSDGSNVSRENLPGTEEFGLTR